MGRISKGCYRHTGRSLHPYYHIWINIISRCTKPSDKYYSRYGGRGITVCKEWADDINTFARDMGERPTGASIDRIDNDSPYAPENCRWATATEQNRNRRRHRRLTYGGETLLQAEWAERLGISQDTLYQRVKRLGVERAIAMGS